MMKQVNYGFSFSIFFLFEENEHHAVVAHVRGINLQYMSTTTRALDTKILSLYSVLMI